MTYFEALGRLDRVTNYLNNLLDIGHRLSNEEIETLISDVDEVAEALTTAGVSCGLSTVIGKEG